jgi:hypothetical protein
MSYALNDAATTAPPDAPNHTKGSSQISRHYPFLTLFSLGQYSLLSSSFYPHLLLMVPYLSPSPPPPPIHSHSRESWEGVPPTVYIPRPSAPQSVYPLLAR